MEFIGKINIFGNSEYLISDIREAIVSSCPADKLFLNFINKPPTKKLVKKLTKNGIKYDNFIYNKLSNNEIILLSKNLNKNKENYHNKLEYRSQIYKQYKDVDYITFGNISKQWEINLFNEIGVNSLKNKTIFIFYDKAINTSVWKNYFDEKDINIFKIVNRKSLIKKDGLVEYKSDDLIPILIRELKIDSVIN